MTKSWVYTDKGITFSLEKIIRDDNSLIIAKDISIEAPKTEPVVILSRLKKRKNGVEVWLYRHYFSPDKFVEDWSEISYTENEKTIRKRYADTDSLIIAEVDKFDDRNRLLYKSPGISEARKPFLSFYFGESNHTDSSVINYFDNNDKNLQLLETSKEYYKYELDSLGNQSKKYTYRNDSLLFVTEYKYGFRK